MKRELKSATLKIIALLMSYPEKEMVDACGEVMDILRKEGWLSNDVIENIGVFTRSMREKDVFDLQDDYVYLFDRTPSLSLHLFEHVHGDSRDRGQAMVELDMLYREQGLYNSSEHTPDYLPMFLEYLSTLSADEARHHLDGAVDVVAIIAERLHKRQSGYACLFDALKEAAVRKPDEKKLQSALVLDSGDPLTEAQMDDAWEEQFAFDMNKENQNGGCPKAEDMLARMNTPAPSKEVRS